MTTLTRVARPPARSGRGTAAGRNVGSRVRATDPDQGDVLTYSLSGTDAALFDINPATGQIRTEAVLDYDPDPDATNKYSVQVRVHDGFGPDYQSTDVSVDATIEVTITVTARPAPAVRPSPTPPPPSGSGGTTGGGSEGGDGGGSQIGGGGGGGEIAPIAVPSVARNRPPAFTDGLSTNRSVVESAALGTDIGRPVTARDADGDHLVYTLGGLDANAFDINTATGQLTTKAALDRETKSRYTVSVSVSDGKASTGAPDTAEDDRITVTITVTSVELTETVRKYDLNEDGIIDRSEVISAIFDYFDEGINRDEVSTLVFWYFESPVPGTGEQGENGG